MTSTEPKLSPRATVLWTIAANYNDLVDPAAAAGIKGDGASFGVQLMPQTYTSTAREFERLLNLMRDDRYRSLIPVHDAKGNLIEKASVRKLRWHLLEYHLKAVKTTRAPKLTIAKGHTRKLVKLQVDDNGSPLPIFRIHRHPQARMELAAAATEWQGREWSLRHEPELPVCRDCHRTITDCQCGLTEAFQVAA